MTAPARSLGDVQWHIRLARWMRALYCVVAAIESMVLTAYLATGRDALAIGMAFGLMLAAVVTALQSHVIRRLRRTEARLLAEARPRPYLAPAVAPGALASSGNTVEDFALGMARLAAVIGSCAHPDAVPVDLLVTGETVAWLCPGCGEQLPAGWAPEARRSATRGEDGERSCRCPRHYRDGGR